MIQVAVVCAREGMIQVAVVCAREGMIQVASKQGNADSVWN